MWTNVESDNGLNVAETINNKLKWFENQLKKNLKNEIECQGHN